MLSQSLRRWPSIEPALVQRLVLAHSSGAWRWCRLYESSRVIYPARISSGSQQARDIVPMMAGCWASVADGSPTLGWALVLDGTGYHPLQAIDLLTLKPQNYLIVNFTHLKLCLADAIHNFKWVKIIQIWQNGGQLFRDHSYARQNLCDEFLNFYILVKI